MKKIAIYTLLLLSLVLTPVVQAAEFDCCKGNFSDVSKNTKESDSKQSKVEHCCQCNHVLNQANNKDIDNYFDVSATVIVLKYTSSPLNIISPLLEPPLSA